MEEGSGIKRLLASAMDFGFIQSIALLEKFEEQQIQWPPTTYHLGSGSLEMRS